MRKKKDFDSEFQRLVKQSLEDAKKAEILAKKHAEEVKRLKESLYPNTSWEELERKPKVDTITECDLEGDSGYRKFDFEELIEFAFDHSTNDAAARKAQRILIWAKKKLKKGLNKYDIRFYIPIPPLKNYRNIMAYYFADEIE
jgi:hypothetical protein